MHLSHPERARRFESLVLCHLDAAYRLARWLLRDPQAAHDAVQDASLRAFRFFDGMLGPTPKAWFMTIVRNVCMDTLAATKRRGEHEPYDDTQHDLPALDAGGAPESPESIALRSDEARWLHASLEALPHDFREVLVLRELEELSYREISAIVGVPIGTVMSRLSRGRDLLARRLRESSERNVL